MSGGMPYSSCAERCVSHKPIISGFCIALCMKVRSRSHLARNPQILRCHVVNLSSSVLLSTGLLPFVDL